MNEKVQEIMKLLDCDEQTAKQVLADDEKIDKGEKLFEQTAEQKANSKRYRQGERKPYTFTKRERKADDDKRKLVELLASAVGMVTQVEPTVTNVERQIDFEFNGRKFRVVLSAPRT